MVRMADSRWPESLQQQQATTKWNDTLKGRAANSPQMLGWQQTRADLRSFAELLVQREQAKEGFTLSYIKTVVYQAERSLNQDTPLEYLLTQYQQAQSAGKIPVCWKTDQRTTGRGAESLAAVVAEPDAGNAER